MKTSFRVLCALLCASINSAQISFTIDDLHSQEGEFLRMYVDSSNIDVSQSLGSKGGPQRWDFSANRTSSEDIHRLEIVPADDGGHGNLFRNAVYAERLTRESNSARSWSYYKILTGKGRAYFGFYDPVSNANNPQKVFESETVDLPATIVLGQSWTRTVEFDDLIDSPLGELPVAVHFTATATVDAFGTVVLPSLGERPALRVSELHSYEAQDTLFGLPLGTTHVRNYYWLVKGIGKAVEIISAPGTSKPPENLSQAKTLMRVFESSAASEPSQPRPVKHLLISRKGAEVFLAWENESSSSSFQILGTEILGGGSNWIPLAETSKTFWFDSLATFRKARFYKVFLIE